MRKLLLMHECMYVCVWWEDVWLWVNSILSRHFTIFIHSIYHAIYNDCTLLLSHFLYYNGICHTSINWMCFVTISITVACRIISWLPFIFSLFPTACISLSRCSARFLSAYQPNNTFFASRQTNSKKSQLIDNNNDNKKWHGLHIYWNCKPHDVLQGFFFSFSSHHSLHNIRS